jgi:hypothetical protein
MNKIITRLQALRDKAAKLQKAVDAAPNKAAQLRDAVQTTTGQLRQLRADVQGSVAALKSDNDASLAQTLVELDAGVGVLASAGYELTGVDLEQGLLPRAIVHLERVTGARTTPLETLLRETVGQRLLQGVLQALIRAEALEREVKLSDLQFSGLIVHVGAAPTVRLCWRRSGEDLEESHPVTSRPVIEHSAKPPTITAPPPLPAYGSGSFFEKFAHSQTSVASGPETARVVSSVPVVEDDVPNPALAPTRLGYRSSSASRERAVPSSGDRGKDVLARFKKMPDLTK